jgi:hypothetical protein
VLLATLLTALPGTASAYVECGNPRGSARNVTAIDVGCSDARSFARKVARRGITSSQYVTIPGWRTYYATVRRVGNEYDVRATRDDKVIRFQYRTGGGRSNCDPNYSGCLDADAYDYDCIEGSGDGPEYTGEVRVYGDDHFGLDRDGDGVGCDDQ